jgi:hypothetical protein
LTSDELCIYAREVLGLVLDADDAAELARDVASLSRWTKEMEAIPLPYTQEPFSSPKLADRWLERY